MSLEELAGYAADELDDDDDEFSPKCPLIWLSMTIEGDDNRFICAKKKKCEIRFKSMKIVDLPFPIASIQLHQYHQTPMIRRRFDSQSEYWWDQFLRCTFECALEI